MPEAMEALFRGLLPGVSMVEARDRSLLGVLVDMQGVPGAILPIIILYFPKTSRDFAHAEAWCFGNLPVIWAREPGVRRERVCLSSKILVRDKMCTCCTTEHPWMGNFALYVYPMFIVTILEKREALESMISKFEVLNPHNTSSISFVEEFLCDTKFAIHTESITCLFV